MKRAPRLPGAVWSQHGPVSVTVGAVQDRTERGYTFGRISMTRREISLDEDCVPRVQWATLGHEIGELLLFDAGLPNILDECVKEAICDAIGSWIAGAVLDGSLKFAPNRQVTDEIP